MNEHDILKLYINHFILILILFLMIIMYIKLYTKTRKYKLKIDIFHKISKIDVTVVYPNGNIRDMYRVTDDISHSKIIKCAIELLKVSEVNRLDSYISIDIIFDDGDFIKEVHIKCPQASLVLDKAYVLEVYNQIYNIKTKYHDLRVGGKISLVATIKGSLYL